MFSRSSSKFKSAVLRCLATQAEGACWGGACRSGLNPPSIMAVLRYDAVQTGPQLFQHSKQGHSFSTFASRAFQQPTRGKVQAPQSLHSALEPCNTLFHVPGPQSSGRVVWSGRGRTMSSMSPENVVYGIMALNGAVFIAWQQPSLQQFMTQHFTGARQGPLKFALGITDGTCHRQLFPLLMPFTS